MNNVEIEETRIREARRQYLQRWRKENKARVREYNKRYWKRRVEREKREGVKNENE